MHAFKYHYPGDPVEVCVVLNRSEFLELFPREPIRVSSFGNGIDKPPTTIEEIAIGPNHIQCDLCCEDPVDEIYVIYNGSRGYCKRCAEVSIIKYKVEGSEISAPSTSTVRYVLVHPEDGIYLGSCMGLGFWTKLDPAGQPEACTFESEADMWKYINSWNQNKDLDRRKCGFSAVPVEPTTGTSYASIADCVKAGLEAWNPD